MLSSLAEWLWRALIRLLVIELIVIGAVVGWQLQAASASDTTPLTASVKGYGDWCPRGCLIASGWIDLAEDDLLVNALAIAYNSHDDDGWRVYAHRAVHKNARIIGMHWTRPSRRTRPGNT